MEKPLCTCKHCCLCVKCCHLLGFIRRHSTSSRPHLTMPPRRKLSNFDRARAVAWFQDGVTKREVARRLQVSISVIVRLIQRYTATGRVQERRRSGRPKKTNPREDCLIERQALQTRTASSSIVRSRGWYRFYFQTGFLPVLGSKNRYKNRLTVNDEAPLVWCSF